MKLQFRVTVKKGPKVLATYEGVENLIDARNLTVEEVTTKIIETEQFLEKLTGLRHHIEQIY